MGGVFLIFTFDENERPRWSSVRSNGRRAEGCLGGINQTGRRAGWRNGSRPSQDVLPLLWRTSRYLENVFVCCPSRQEIRLRFAGQNVRRRAGKTEGHVRATVVAVGVPSLVQRHGFSQF